MVFIRRMQTLNCLLN